MTEALPILCVDVVLRNPRGKYLLVKRANAPKKDQWWVVGGRVLKGETLEEAVVRKVKEETGITVTSLLHIGYFETVADTNPFDLPFPYHAVSVVFEAAIGSAEQVVLDDQSAAWSFADALPSDFTVRRCGAGT